jgi:hypothetical protein
MRVEGRVSRVEGASDEGRRTNVECRVSRVKNTRK